MKRTVLERLPVAIIRAKRDDTGEWVKVLVDGDYDAEYFREFNWAVNHGGYVYKRTRELVLNEGTGETTGAHRHLYTYLHQLVLPAREGLWTHHINGNKLDCRSVNLEYITPHDSCMNRKLFKIVSNRKYRGVSYPSDNHGPRYWVRIQKRYIGGYDTAEEAARAYDREAIRVFGDRAILNFPKEG